MSLMYRLMYRVGARRGTRAGYETAQRAEQSELTGRFADWELVSAEPDTDGEISGPLRHVPRTWYRLARR